MHLGASRTIARSDLARSCKPLEKELWAAAIDSVGSTTLATVLSQLKYRGIVAACGLAGGFDLPGSVMPFLLRNVALQGIDSVMAPMPVRQRAWDDLADAARSASHAGRLHRRTAGARAGTGRCHTARRDQRPRRHRRQSIIVSARHKDQLMADVVTYSRDGDIAFITVNNPPVNALSLPVSCRSAERISPVRG